MPASPLAADVDAIHARSISSAVRYRDKRESFSYKNELFAILLADLPDGAHATVDALIDRAHELDATLLRHGVYVVWMALLAAALRARLATLALRLPAPAQPRRAWQRQVDAANHCGCNGCDKGGTTGRQSAQQPVRIVPRTDRPIDRNLKGRARR